MAGSDARAGDSLPLRNEVLGLLAFLCARQSGARERTSLAMNEHFGVIESGKTYTHHAVARVLGLADTKGRCSQFVMNRLLRGGVPFCKVGRIYFISGQLFNLWVQENSSIWEGAATP